MSHDVVTWDVDCIKVDSSFFFIIRLICFYCCCFCLISVKDATFFILKVTENPALYAFELYSHPTWFIRHLKHKPYKVVLSKVNESSKEVMDSTFYLSPHDCPLKKKKHGNAQFRTFLFLYTLQPVERNPVTTFSLVYAKQTCISRQQKWHQWPRTVGLILLHVVSVLKTQDHWPTAAQKSYETIWEESGF